MKVKGISEFKPYTVESELSEYNLNDLLPKIWADGYERRDAWFEFDIVRRLFIEAFKIYQFPAKIFLIYYILRP